MSRGVPRRPALLMAALCLLVTGCAGLPDSGSVHVAEGQEPTMSAAPFDFNPPKPAAGSSKEQVVAGFLRALQATPVSTQRAAEFLSADAAGSWRPDRGTIVYDGHSLRGTPAGVSVDLERSFDLDARGRWVGPGGSGGRGPTSRSLALRLVPEDGEWRITDPPDAMVIPQNHFQSRYREYSLYFLDPTGSVLVPEPVYLPWGVQAPTLLVKALLSGPAPENRTVERTFFPATTRLGVSVPVRDDGVAEVPLTGGALDLEAEQLDLALAQLAWTLRQLGDVEAFRVTVDGEPLEIPGGETVVGVNGWGELSPDIASASTDLFGLRRRAVVQVVGGEQITAASLGDDVGPVRSLGVDLSSQRFALVTADGRAVLTLGRSGNEPAEPVTTYTGNDVLRPMWDRTGRLWIVDRTPVGARVLVADEERVRRVVAPGLDGRDVVAAALSRDGTRLVAAVEDAGRDGRRSTTRLLMLRVVRQGAGAPMQLTRATVVGTPAPLSGVRGLGWRDPTTVAVLTRPSATTSQVVLVAGDGASRLATFDAAVDVLFDEAVGLTASPGGPMALVVATRGGQLHELDLQGRWVFDSVVPRLRAPTFVG